ncbi:MAG: beta-L-arabinofuranosidase domain-containing protein, partial [Bacteroidia bacterium]
MFAYNGAQAQQGDQLLDGIGETSLVARYTFNGDLKDWSRNSFHAKMPDTVADFINDPRFGKVLSLAGHHKSFVALPTEVFANLESFTISGWVNLRSNQVSVIEVNKWTHFAVVTDVSSKMQMLFINGKQLAEAKDLSPILGLDLKNKVFYIGKSLSFGKQPLNALIHDFRLYRVPLSSQQINSILYAQSGVNESAVNTNPKRENDLPQFASGEAQLYNRHLIGVSDVQVYTELGSLPRLPSQVKGTYKNALNGPKVRVLWPAAHDNSAALQSGTYTVTGTVVGTTFKPKALVTVRPSSSPKSPVLKLETFPLNRVALQKYANGKETKFIENRDKFIRTLAKTDPNSFLYMFRHAFHQQQPAGAKPLGVWDTQDTKLRGHATGHYLTAIAQAYASTEQDKALQANFALKMQVMVDALYELSQLSGTADPSAVPYGPGKLTYDSDLSDAGIRTDHWSWGKGFISAYPPDQFIMLEKGAKYGGQKHQIWAPYYTLHKILAGLMDVYEVSGNKKALNIATGMGNWVYARLSKLPTETLMKMWNTYIAGEFGGMNEAMARLYGLTGDQKYFKTAQLFDNVKVFYGDAQHSHGLAKNVDMFRGLHANQHIPQIVGSIGMYQASNDPVYFKIADNFWYKAVNDYMYSIGGVAGARHPANAECFISEPATLYQNGFSEGGQNETCATYNMLKLTSNLFLFEQRTALMDYYERALYNHILASVAQDSPANTYHVSLRPGVMKEFSNADMTGFTCCNGTALESNTKLQNAIYFKAKDQQALYINLFIPSVLQWTERNIRLEQTTNFPNEDHTRLKISG